jgi:hypothetical protein
MVHEGRWQLVRTDDGRLLTVPPQTFSTTARAPDGRPFPAAGRPTRYSCRAHKSASTIGGIGFTAR